MIADSVIFCKWMKEKLQFTITKACHPEWSEAESRDLRTDEAKKVKLVRRSFDSLRAIAV